MVNSLPFLVIGGGFVAGIVCISIAAWRERGSKRWLVAVGGVLALTGAGGFFGSGLFGAGGLNWLPESFEWPVGYVNGVVTTVEGIHVVPHTPSGRVQLYDAEWRFVRGWWVDAEGGHFEVVAPAPNRIEVFTARGGWHYVFDLDGALISKRTIAPGQDEVPARETETLIVPTAPWAWPFSHPIIVWGLVLVGMVLLGIGKQEHGR